MLIWQINLMSGLFSLSSEVLEMCTLAYQGSSCSYDSHKRRLQEQNSHTYHLWILSPIEKIQDLPRYRHSLGQTALFGCVDNSQPHLKIQHVLLLRMLNIQAAIWPRTYRQALVGFGLCSIVETRLDMVTNLSLGRYALVVTESIVAYELIGYEGRLFQWMGET